MAPIVRLLSLTTTAGLLKDVSIEPAPGLTCVIGEPSSGKSTFVETFRFAMNLDPSWVNMLLGFEDPDYGASHPEFGHLRETLEGGSAICRLEVDYGNRKEILRVERNAENHVPHVYKDGTDVPADPSLLECVEIYSQGDIQRIAEDTRRRLTLLDRRERQKIESLWNQIGLLAAEANDLDLEYAVAGELIENHTNALTTLGERRVRLAFLRERRPAAPPEVEAKQREYDARRLLLETLKRLEEERTRDLLGLAETARKEEGYRDTLRALADQGQPEALDLANALVVYSDLLRAIESTAHVMKGTNFPALTEKLRARFEELDRPYHKLQEEQQQFAQALREEDEVRGEVQRLEKIEIEKKRQETRRVELRRRRAALRLQVRQAKAEIYKTREQLADQINEQFKTLVKIKVREGAYSPPDYKKAISEILQGSRFKNQDELAKDLATVPPVELISAVEERDATFLAEFLCRDVAQMKRVVDWLCDLPDRDIYRLERFVFDDDLEISLNMHGEWRAIRGLSRGKKALALLPIILMDGNALLVGDQLEDSINNRLIMEALVGPAQRLERQLILVTHNANIALLTKADRVIVLEDEGGKVRATPATVKEDGARHVLNLLEGGSQPFKGRTEIYGDLLKEPEPGA